MTRKKLVATSAGLWLALVVIALGALGAAWFAGWKLNVVDTGSMAPEIPSGSLVVVVPTRPAAVAVGDVVSFPDPQDSSRMILHRVVRVIDSSEGPLLQTQGDANATPDPTLVPATSIDGRLQQAVPHLGTVVRVLQPPVGGLILIGVPIIVFAVSEVRRGRARRSRTPTAIAHAVAALHPSRHQVRTLQRVPR